MSKTFKGKFLREFIGILLLFGGASVHAEYVYCSGIVDRVQIEGSQYLLFIKGDNGAVTPHNFGNVGEVLADKYYAMSLAAFSMRAPFTIRYTDPTTTNCASIRGQVSKISYFTIKN